MSAQVIHDDCRAALAAMDEASIDAVVTDPPYHLTSIVKRFGSPDAAPALSNGPTGVYARASRGFMGKTWDGGDVAFQPETWAAVVRVLKPGGHLVAFGGTRTYHRMAVAIEDAGFEIRDCLFWLYGSGFPKSLDVAKAIDKQRQEDKEPTRVVCRFVRQALDRQGLKSRDLVAFFDGCHPRLIDHWAARDSDSQPALPTWAQWIRLKEVLALGPEMDAEVRRLNERKGEPGDAWKGAEAVGTPGGFGEHRFSVRDNIKRQSSEASAQWEGWGTALKPACEPVVLARKPLSGTVAENVETHGTGALNIDECRVGTEGGTKAVNHVKKPDGRLERWDEGSRGARNEIVTLNAGRWPANLVHDGSDEVLAGFPETGPSRGIKPGSYSQGMTKGNVNDGWRRLAHENYQPKLGGHDDSGSAARYFYCAKASAAERAGSKHPTVKPLALMRWLCRLVTPPGGLVLDPFAGTGTTGAAALAEGFRTILIEREAEYIADIERRLAGVTPRQPDIFGGAA